ncbi:MAG TPA: hypothetical protein VK612_09040 [Pyrinomonadaceae bacterium]|nr:hypothetical protein [Pyrinomonadaceae bacterium]
MHTNSKKYLVISESRETTIVTRAKQIFRKAYCPQCGGETGLFWRDGDEHEPHVFICSKHTEEIRNETKFLGE